jgi:2-phospho-L-lactate transferase CofD
VRAVQEHEVFPAPNPRLLSEVARADAVVYGMGSLYTSICPSLILAGVGEAIAARGVPKLLLLNGSHDRETLVCGAHAGPMSASDIVLAVRAADGAPSVCQARLPGARLSVRLASARESARAPSRESGQKSWLPHESASRLRPAGFARHFFSTPCLAARLRQVCDALNRRHTPRGLPLNLPPTSYVTAVLAPRDGAISVAADELYEMGITKVCGRLLARGGGCQPATRCSSCHLETNWSYLACRIGHWVPIWQQCIGSSL